MSRKCGCTALLASILVLLIIGTLIVGVCLLTTGEDQIAKYTGLAEVLLILVLAVEGVAAIVQLRQMRDDSNAAAAVAMLDRTIRHNKWFYKDEEVRKYLAQSGKVTIQPSWSEQEQKMFYAVFELNLSHINLLWQVWELEGGKRPSSSDGWTAWARGELKTMKDMETSRPKPCGQAAFEILERLRKGSDIWPEGFRGWLLELLGERVGSRAS